MSGTSARLSFIALEVFFHDLNEKRKNAPVIKNVVPNTNHNKPAMPEKKNVRTERHMDNGNSHRTNLPNMVGLFQYESTKVCPR